MSGHPFGRAFPCFYRLWLSSFTVFTGWGEASPASTRIPFSHLISKHFLHCLSSRPSCPHDHEIPAVVLQLVEVHESFCSMGYKLALRQGHLFSISSVCRLVLFQNLLFPCNHLVNNDNSKPSYNFSLVAIYWLRALQYTRWRCVRCVAHRSLSSVKVLVLWEGNGFIYKLSNLRFPGPASVEY